MHLKRIEVTHLRNLTSVSLYPSLGLNIIEGANASGKTSLLEALHTLALARSFRTLKSEHLVQHESDSLTLFAEVVSSGHHRIGIQRFRDNHLLMRLDGAAVESRAQLASLIPMQLITPESVQLLTGAPSERRQFIDWMMFHVEHSFHSSWSDYQRILKQRNALLRSGQTATLSQWSEALVENGIRIDELRKSVIGRLLPHIRDYTSLLLPDMQLALSYRQGWKSDISYAEAVNNAVETDIKMKFTTVGPHRADLVFRDGDARVTDIFSRGQLKLLLCALKLGQMSLFRQETGTTPVVLIDDLPAELDSEHRALLLSLLHELDAQVFVTTTDRALLRFEGWEDVKLFHVEHGDIKEVV